MNLFDLLKLWEPTFSPEQTKVHLARYNGEDHPLDVFIQGGFDVWQSRQSNRNFKLPYVVSLIQAGSPTRWLFAGLFRTMDCVERDGPKPDYIYTLERVPAAEEWVGRLLRTAAASRRSRTRMAISAGCRRCKPALPWKPVAGSLSRQAMCSAHCSAKNSR